MYAFIPESTSQKGQFIFHIFHPGGLNCKIGRLELERLPHVHFHCTGHGCRRWNSSLDEVPDLLAPISVWRDATAGSLEGKECLQVDSWHWSLTSEQEKDGIDRKRPSAEGMKRALLS